MDLNEMKLGDLKELLALLKGGNSSETAYKLGQSYLFRTVTHYWVGKIVSIYENEVVLENASWVADTGRFSECLSSGFPENAEYETAIGKTIVHRAAIVDASEWKHELPKTSK